MTRESGQPENFEPSEISPAPEVPPTTVHLQVGAAKKLNLAAFQNAVPALTELVIVNETASSISDFGRCASRSGRVEADQRITRFDARRPNPPAAS